MTKSLKLKAKLLLFKLLSNDPVIMGCDWFYSDTHHVFGDINTQINIMLSVMINSIDESDLISIDNMYLKEETIYKRLKKKYVYQVKLYNKLLSDLKKSGISFSDLVPDFKEMYELRARFFRIICNKYPELAFKTKKHFDEENDPMFNGDFLAGIYTPYGVVTYHFKLKYFDDFNVPEIERGPRYTNYSIQDGLYRLASLVNKNMVVEHLEKQFVIDRKTRLI